MGLHQILRWCILQHEREDILWECDAGVAGGHVGGKAIVGKILQVRLWWPTIHKDLKAFAKECDVYQRVVRPSRRDELPLHLVHMVQIFDKWEVDFIGPISPLAHHSKAWNIITTTEYLSRWAEEVLTKDCTVETAVCFIFENIISRFRCPRSLTSDQVTHFLNETIQVLLTTFMVQHHKSIPYHEQANGVVEEFNKILEKGLTKIVLANRDDWDKRNSVTLWAYRTIVKRLHKQTPF